MPRLDEYVTIKQAAEYLGVAPNSLRNWDAAGKIPVYRHPENNYRLFKVADLKRLLRRIEKLGRYPTGWKRDVKRNRKPR